MGRSRHPPGRVLSESARLEAPTDGVNTVDPPTALPVRNCLRSYNLIPSEVGLRGRTGSREWVTGLTGAADNYVRTLLPYAGSDSTADKLWAMTSSGIWDCSASTAAPAVSIAFGDTSGDAGYGIGRVFVTAAGHFGLYCDEVNGYYVWTESPAAWAKVAQGAGATQINNVDPADFVFVTVHKKRAWFVERDSASAWYLAADAIYGAATEFNFGPQFRAGGRLVGLWSWTYDGGAGPDDYLVALSSAGDVVVYQGTDPSSASTWGLKGVYYVGELPKGRRIATDNGGDLAILSPLGLVPLSRLVLGIPKEAQSQFTTRNIASEVEAAILTKRSLHGWALTTHPTDAALLMLVPTAEGAATTQWAMAYKTGGWFAYRDLPAYSAAPWSGELYIGTVDGRVLRCTDYVDGVTLADPNAYTPVQCSLLFGFQNLGNMRLKQISMVRPSIQSYAAASNVQATAVYGLDLTEPAAPSPPSASGTSVWDTAVWDTSLWGGDFTPAQPIQGATGLGREVAVWIRFGAVTRTGFTGLDVLYTEGGTL